MDAALRAYLLSCKNREADIWVATSGILVSGRTTSVVEFFAEAARRSGKDDKEIYRGFEEGMSAKDNAAEPGSDEQEPDPLIQFADANVFINGRFAFRTAVSVDPEKIGAWGPALMSPRED
ncbi:MAG TPA: hypothetical protein VFF68_10040 [Anaerolineaceae bacterium]|nr:hypothetical protein [Anaerolineaceae bacterium]